MWVPSSTKTLGALACITKRAKGKWPVQAEYTRRLGVKVAALTSAEVNSGVDEELEVNNVMMTSVIPLGSLNSAEKVDPWVLIQARFKSLKP